MIKGVTELAFVLLIQRQIDLTVRRRYVIPQYKARRRYVMSQYELGRRYVIRRYVEAVIQQVAPARDRMFKQRRFVLAQYNVTVVKRVPVRLAGKRLAQNSSSSNSRHHYRTGSVTCPTAPFGLNI
jgi:hypothetical protein